MNCRLFEVILKKSNLKRHVTSVHTEKYKFQCPFCDKESTRRDELVRYHIVDKHPERLVEVQRRPELIQEITDRRDQQPKKKRRKEQKDREKKSPQKNKSE